jgi:hypothetical protein
MGGEEASESVCEGGRSVPGRLSCAERGDAEEVNFRVAVKLRYERYLFRLITRPSVVLIKYCFK